MTRLASILCVLVLGCSASKSSSDEPNSTAGPADPQPAEPANTDPNPPVPNEPQVVPENPEPTNPEPASPSNSVKLTHFDTKLEVATGTELRYSFKSHASVGYGAKFEIGDPKVLRHVRTDVEYEQSKEERADKDGADAATGTFVFEAVAPGRSTLKVLETFRGKTELERDYKITVIEP